jgi:predicted MFS family arabinose efflux permease
LGSFVAPLQAEFGWSRTDVTSSFLYSTITLALISPLLGALIDGVGVRRLSLISIPLVSIVLFLMSRAGGSVWTFHALFALSALVGGGTTPISYTRAVNAVFYKGRGLALGISLAGIGIAAIVLPLFLAWIIQLSGWRTAYLALALLALVPWPFVWWGINPSQAEAPKTSNQTVDRGALRTTVFWTIGIAFAAVGIAVSALVVHMIPLLRDAGMSSLDAARTTSIIGIGVLGGRLLIGYVIDRFFAPYIAALMFSATALGCLLLLVTGVTFAPLAALLIGFSLGAEVDLIAYLIARYFGMARYGFLYAISYAMFAIGAAAGPALAGILFDARRNYDTTLWCVIALLVFGAAAIATLPRFEAFERRRLADATVPLTR